MLQLPLPTAKNVRTDTASSLTNTVKRRKSCFQNKVGVWGEIWILNVNVFFDYLHNLDSMSFLVTEVHVNTLNVFIVPASDWTTLPTSKHQSLQKLSESYGSPPSSAIEDTKPEHFKCLLMAYYSFWLAITPHTPLQLGKSWESTSSFRANQSSLKCTETIKQQNSTLKVSCCQTEEQGMKAKSMFK